LGLAANLVARLLDLGETTVLLLVGYALIHVLDAVAAAELLTLPRGFTPTRHDRVHIPLLH